MKLKKVIKKGLIVLSIYLVAVAATLIVNGRVQQLDERTNIDNNRALSINLSK